MLLNVNEVDVRVADRGIDARVLGVFENSAEYCVIATDLDGVIRVWNEGARRVYGYEPEDVIGRETPAILYAPEEVAAGKPGQVLEAARRDGRWEGTVERITKSGTRFTAHIVVAMRRDQLGRPCGFMHVSKHASDESTLIEELRVARDTMAGLVASAMDAIVSIDSGGRIALFNRAAELMFGYTAEEVLGHPMDILIPERFRRKHERQVDDFGRTGATTRRMGALSAVCGMRKDGTEFPLEVSISRYEARGRKHYTAIMRDVTERHRAVEALREKEERFRQIAENISEVFYLSDLERRIIYVSPAFEAIWGRSVQSVYEAPDSWMEAIPDPDRQAVAQALSVACVTGRFDVEHRVVRPDGTTRYVRCRGFPIHDEKGLLYRIAGVAEDMTDVELARRQIVESARRYAGMLANVQLISIMADREGILTYCNDYFLQVTGWK
jgi:PAS domain S-box-containing protein